MRRPNKYDWPKLKIEFLRGEWLTARAFLHDKKISNGPVSSFETKGWAEEKKMMSIKALKIATEEILEENVNEEKKVRERQAKLGRALQLKGFKALEHLDPKTVEDARKLIQTGLIQERDALGISGDKKGGGPNSLTQVNINLPKTKLDGLIDGLDSEGILKLIAELRRQRKLRVGTVSDI